MSRETVERVKAEVEHLVAIGKITFQQGADRIENVAKAVAKEELDHFGRTQAREVQRRPWAVPALAIAAVSEGFVILGLLVWLVTR